MLKEGTQAPDFTLPTVNDQSFSLSEVWQQGCHVLLIFLRHLAWMHCREHVVHVHQHKDEFEALDTRVLIIGFEKKRRAKGWLKRTDVTFPFLLDRDREVYDAYQIERSVLRSWSPKNLWSYLKALFKGQIPDLIKADPNQLGADFIVDKTGVLHFTYYSPDPTYRPTVDELLADLRSLR